MGANKDLGLPIGIGMQKIAICFDVDGTLIDTDDRTYDTIIDLVKAISACKWKNVRIFVWSGGGWEYADIQARRLGLEPYIDGAKSKLSWQDMEAQGYTIIAIDDIQDTRMGVANMIVRNK